MRCDRQAGTLDSRSGVSAADNRSRFSGDTGETCSYALLPRVSLLHSLQARGNEAQVADAVNAAIKHHRARQLSTNVGTMVGNLSPETAQVSLFSLMLLLLENPLLSTTAT